MTESSFAEHTGADANIRAGVDVGGTFTDLVVLDTRTGELSSAKVPTNYTDPIASIEHGIELACPGATPYALHHATTLSTNAILERNLPAGALLTTMGFRDVLDIGRIQRPEAGIYDFNVDTPEPLIDRQWRLEVTERMDAQGQIITALDEAHLRQKLTDIQQNPDITTIAVCCLFAFVNDEHEQHIARIIKDALPNHYVSLSSEVAPEIREFERSSTVVLDALLKPLLAPYLRTLDTRMRDRGIATTHIMMASGGLTLPQQAAEKPVNTINSGPSAGVLAAANLGRQIDIADLITIDMGGTSLDIGVIENGHSVQKYESTIAGYPVRVPAIDVAAVAAGGGSLALVDSLGYIQVDRESAGSTPGPACYGRGGTRPTITDADVLLGRLGTDLQGRGGFSLDAEAAKTAMQTAVCASLGIDVDTAATSVLDIIQARMFKAIASNTLEKGLDIRSLPLLAYGGAGPTHAVELATAMSINRVIIPYFAGNFSAVGLLLCPQRWDTSRMVLKTIDAIDVEQLSSWIQQLATACHTHTDDTSNTQDLTCRWLAHLRYAGQSYDLAIPYAEPWQGQLPDNCIADLVDNFHALHQRRYAYSSSTETVELVQLRVSLSGPELDYPQPPLAPTQTLSEGAHHQRRVYFTTDRQWHTTSVYPRHTLAAEQLIDGPAVIEGEGSSALIPPGWTARVDPFASLDVRKRLE